MDSLFTPVFAVIGIILLFISRSVYRIFHKDPRGDAYYHLLLIEDIRNSGHRLPMNVSSIPTSRQYNYPYLVHWILSFFPKSMVETIERYFSGIMDIGLALLLLGLFALGILTGPEWLVAFIILLTTPQFVRPDMPHGLGISARKPGVLLTSVSTLSYIFWVELGVGYWIAPAIAVGGLVLLTSRFSLQAMLFISIPFLLYSTINTIGWIVGSYMIAMIVSFGSYHPILTTHIRHVYNYAISKQFKISHTRPKFKILPGVYNISNIKEFLESIHESDLLRPLANNPFLVPLAIIFITSSQYDGTIIYEGLSLWIAGGIFGFLLTSLPYLRFLGEPERYLEYAFVPSVVIISQGVGSFGIILDGVIYLSIVGGGVVILTYYLMFFEESYSQEGDVHFKRLVDELTELNEGVVVVQPEWKAREIAYRTNHQIVSNIGAPSSAESIQEVETLFPDKFGWVTDDKSWLIETYNPDWLVIDRRKQYEPPDSALGPPTYSPIYENADYELYRFYDCHQK